MEINVQSVKFNADDKLLEFIDKKVGKITKFYDNIVRTDVTLSLLAEHDNKNVKIKVGIPGNDLIVERNAARFEDAVTQCVDVISQQLVARKEKQRGK